MSPRVLTPILTIVILTVGFFQTSISDNDFSTLEKWQLGAVFVGALVTYWVPLIAGKWKNIFKVGGAVLGVVLAAIITGIQTGNPWDASMVTVVVLAGLNAFATQVGSDQRVRESKKLLADPAVTVEEAKAADPGAVKVALATGAVINTEDTPENFRRHV